LARPKSAACVLARLGPALATGIRGEGDGVPAGVGVCSAGAGTDLARRDGSLRRELRLGVAASPPLPPADLGGLCVQSSAPPRVATAAGAVGRDEGTAKRLTPPPVPIDAKKEGGSAGDPGLRVGKPRRLERGRPRCTLRHAYPGRGHGPREWRNWRRLLLWGHGRPRCLRAQGKARLGSRPPVSPLRRLRQGSRRRGKLWGVDWR
jgi:hypothetical protein